MAGIKKLWFQVFLLISVLATCRSADPDCVYTLYVRTGSIIRAGTDSKITATFYDTKEEGIEIQNLESWGVMGPGHNYFEMGNVDIFTNKAPCMATPICALNLTSDGSGAHHGWYCDYVELTVAAVHKPCVKKTFKVEKWLARDTAPYSLTAEVDLCGQGVAAVGDKSQRSRSLVAEV